MIARPLAVALIAAIRLAAALSGLTLAHLPRLRLPAGRTPLATLSRAAAIGLAVPVGFASVVLTMAPHEAGARPLVMTQAAAALGAPSMSDAARATATVHALRKAAHLRHVRHVRLVRAHHRQAVRRAALLAAQQEAAAEQAAQQQASTPQEPPVSSDPGPVAAAPQQPQGQPPAASGAYSYAQLEQLWISAGGPAAVASTAAAIAVCESGGNPAAANPSGASGLWQILGQLVPGNIFDPMINALNAVAKYQAAGGSFSPWVCQG